MKNNKKAATSSDFKIWHGRPFAAQSKKLKLSKNTKRIKDLLEKDITKSQIAKIMVVDRMTVSRFIKRQELG